MLKLLSTVSHIAFGPADKPGDATTDVDDNGTNDDGDIEDGDADPDTNEGDDEGSDADDGDDGSSDEEGEPDANASATDKEDWRDRELQRKHAKIKERDRKIAEQEAELAALRAIAEGREPTKKASAAGDPPAAVSQEEAVKIARQQLLQQSAKEKYDTDCNKLYEDGKSRFTKDWDEKLKRIPLLGGVDDDTMQFVLATDDPAQALYALANDPDEYERVMSLPLAKRANALNKLGEKKAPERKKPSNAPPPVTPIRGNNGSGKRRVDLLDDKVSDEDWYATRERQRRERFEKRQGRR